MRPTVLTILAVPEGDVDVASDRLMIAGARAIEERIIVDGGAELRTVLASDEEVSRRRLGELPTGWALWFEVADESPSTAWRDHARPVVISDRLVIAPAWLAAGEGSGELVIEIEPGGSFGLGDHPTTRLCAAAVDEFVEPGCSVLDVGCGSGVLGIIAARRGAGAVVAMDIADAAVEATTDNATRNGVAAVLSATTVPLGSGDELYVKPFDLVLANILAPTLIELADDLQRLTARTGRLVISGILANRHAHVLDALAPMAVRSVAALDGWVAVTLEHPSA